MKHIEGARSDKSYPPGREVLAKVRAREPQALKIFFDQYFERVFAFCFRMLGDRDLAEDVTQEVFFKSWRFADRLDISRDPIHWLLSIALHQCQDQRRSRGQRERASTVSLADLLEVLPSPKKVPEQNLVDSEIQDLVQRALLQIPPKSRAVIVLHDFQGLTHEEIGKVVKLSHSAARKRYSRAMLELGKVLTRQGWS